MNTENLPRIITWLATVLTVIGIVIIPLGVLIMSYENAVGSLETEADIKAINVSQLISSNPLMWEYEHVRMKDLISYGINPDGAVQIHIYNLQDELIASLEGEVTFPVIARRADLFDSGIKVGYMEVTMSLLPVLVRVAIAAFIAIPIGVGGFLFLRFVPIKAMKKADIALKKSEEKYREMIESANDAIFIIDSQFNYIDVNKKAVEIFGYSKEELVTMNIIDVIPPDQLSRSEIQFEKLKIHGSYRNFNGKMRTKDGKWLDVEINSSAIVKDGEVVGSRDIIRDVTERTRAAEVLEREKDKLQIYLDTSAVMVVVINADQTIQLINKKGCETLGCTAEEAVGTNWFDNYIPEYNREMVKDVFKQLMAGNIKPVEYLENRVLTKNGEERIIAWYNTVLSDNQGNIIGTLSSGGDITDRRKMEDALMKSEARYADAAEAAHVGHWERNLISHNVYWSKEIYNVFGVDPTGFMPTFDKFISMVHQDDRLYVNKQIELLLKSNKKINMHYRIMRPDGELRLINAKVETAVDETGKAIKLIGTIQDITEQKRLEESLWRLEQMKLIGEWTKGLSEGVKNSLAGIKASIELFADEKHYSEKDNAVILKASKEIDRIEFTINSLLKFTTPVEPHFMKANINDILEKTVSFSMNHPSFSSSRDNYEIYKEFDSKVPDIIADPFQMQQVFLNLIANSIDAMPAGGTLSLKTLYEEDKNLILVSVSDTGTGMDDNMVNNLFQPFITTKSKGSGLGLAVTRRFIEQHKGEIRLGNTSREGTTFNIHLPVNNFRD